MPNLKRSFSRKQRKEGWKKGRREEAKEEITSQKEESSRESPFDEGTLDALRTSYKEFKKGTPSQSETNPTPLDLYYNLKKNKEVVLRVGDRIRRVKPLPLPKPVEKRARPEAGASTATRSAYTTGVETPMVEQPATRRTIDRREGSSIRRYLEPGSQKYWSRERRKETQQQPKPRIPGAKPGEKYGASENAFTPLENYYNLKKARFEAGKSPEEKANIRQMRHGGRFRVSFNPDKKVGIPSGDVLGERPQKGKARSKLSTMHESGVTNVPSDVFSGPAKKFISYIRGKKKS